MHDDDVNHLDVCEKEWKLNSKCYELHMSCGVAKLSAAFHHHNNKS